MTKKNSLKDRLKNRQLPSVTQSLQIEDPAKAAEQLEDANGKLRQATLRKDRDPETYDKCARAATAAQRALDACYEEITLTALPPKEYEALIEEHPPTEAQIKQAEKDKEAAPEWNQDTLAPALLSACVEGDMTAADWDEFLSERAAKGEKQILFVSALAVNESGRLPESVVLPKGSRVTRT